MVRFQLLQTSHENNNFIKCLPTLDSGTMYLLGIELSQIIIHPSIMCIIYPSDPGEAGANPS